MRVKWFIPVDHTNCDRMPASVWIRCLQILPYLEKEGVECVVNDMDTPADIAVFVRNQDEKAASVARLEREKGSKIVFDMCVNYIDEGGRIRGTHGAPASKVAEARVMCDRADQVICASEFIAQRASTVHENVCCLPDSVDRRHFSYRKPEKDFERKRLRAIWCGVSVKFPDMEPLLPILSERGIDLIVLSDKRTDTMRGLAGTGAGKLHFRKWKYSRFPRDILRGEICISQRPCEDSYNRGHSLFRIGVFASEGVPPIACPVPSYVEFVEKNSVGEICQDLDAWESVLDRIIADREQLVGWSRRGIEAMGSFSTENMAKRYADLFRGLLEGKEQDGGR